MAEKITKARLDHLVEILIRETGGKIDYELDSAYGGYRLVSNKGSHDVSPRMGKTDLYYWIHAFRQGVEVGRSL
jgi:hypothetical protein